MYNILSVCLVCKSRLLKQLKGSVYNFHRSWSMEGIFIFCGHLILFEAKRYIWKTFIRYKSNFIKKYNHSKNFQTGFLIFSTSLAFALMMDPVISFSNLMIGLSNARFRSMARDMDMIRLHR